MTNAVERTRKNMLLTLALLYILPIASCGGNNGTRKAHPTITSIKPSKGEPGDVVAIKGINFSTTAGKNTVRFNGEEATVILSASATEIKAAVPADATTGKITVRVEGLQPAVSTADFEVFSCSALALTLVPNGYGIVAEGSGGATPYEYALDYGDFQSDGTFNGLEAVNYKVTVKDANGCRATETITGEALKSIADTRDGQEYKVIKSGDQGIAR